MKNGTLVRAQKDRVFLAGEPSGVISGNAPTRALAAVAGGVYAAAFAPSLITAWLAAQAQRSDDDQWLTDGYVLLPRSAALALLHDVPRTAGVIPSSSIETMLQHATARATAVDPSEPRAWYTETSRLIDEDGHAMLRAVAWRHDLLAGQREGLCGVACAHKLWLVDELLAPRGWRATEDGQILLATDDSGASLAAVACISAACVAGRAPLLTGRVGGPL